MKIEINNLTKFKIDEKLFTGLAKKIVKGENKEIETLSIAFVGPDEIKAWNKKYRKKDRPTDVLSFELGEGLGEVVICPDMVENGQMPRILAHGVLHLCGHDHERSKKDEEEMQKKEEEYLKII